MTEYNHSPEKGFSMRTICGFKTIWVIESLPAGDYCTGKTLYEDVLRYKNFNKPKLIVELIDVQDRKNLIDVLEKISEDSKSTGHTQLLHLETHGNTEGMSLKNSDFIRYEELLPCLREINVLSQHNLFIVVAACQGAYMAKLLADKLTLVCPFWGICGPSDTISAEDLIKGYTAFYDELLLPSSFGDALAKLKQAIPNHGVKFTILNSEYLFMVAYKNYLESKCSKEAVEKRIRAMVVKSAGNRAEYLNVEDLERRARSSFGTVAGQQLDFDFLKEKFFLHDIYPRNELLPNPSFEMMMKIKLT